MSTAKRLVLIDLSAIFRPVWEAIPETEPASAPHDITLAKVRRLASKYHFAAVCVDSRTNWRTAVGEELTKLDPEYKGYKANRERAPGEMYAQHDRLVDTLKREGFAVWLCEGFEADDVIATAVARVAERNMDPKHEADGDVEIHIATADKDLYQLIAPTVFVQPQRLGTQEEPAPVDRAACLAKFGVPPELVGDYLALVGDSSDNVPGVPGVGEKSAPNLLRDYGDLAGVFEGTKIANPAKKLTARMVDLLQTHKDKCLLSRRLIELRDDAPIDIAEAFKPREHAPRAGTENSRPPTEEEEMTDSEATPGAAPPKDEPKNEPPPAREERTVNNGDGTQSKVHVETKEEPKKEGDAVDRLAGFLPEPGSDEWAAQLEPRTLTQSWWVAETLFNSRLFGFKNPSQAYVAILMGRERGIGAAASAAASDIIEAQGKDKLAWKAEALEGLIKKSPLCEYFEMVSCDDKHATYKTKRVGRPERVWTYKIEQADQASLTGNTANGKPTNWKKRPRNMLRARCKGELAHLEYPDICLGFWSPEELVDFEDDVPERIRETG